MFTKGGNELHTFAWVNFPCFHKYAVLKYIIPATQ